MRPVENILRFHLSRRGAALLLAWVLSLTLAACRRESESKAAEQTTATNSVELDTTPSFRNLGKRSEAKL